MDRFFLCALLFLLSPFFSTAQNAIDFNNQELVYPIRQGHKTGYVYIKPYGAVDCIPPRYDYIADINLPWNTTTPNFEASPYRLFEIDEKVGLLDTFLNEVLPNHYKRIRPISNTHFAAELDSLFVLIDSSGQIIDPTPYQNICPADSPIRHELRYLFVQKDNLWGLKTLEGQLLLDFRYADIQSSEEVGFYKVKHSYNDSKWQLINSKGELVLRRAYEEIIMLDKNLVAVKNQSWQLFRRNPSQQRLKRAWSLLKIGQFTKVEKINSSLASFTRIGKSGGKIELWNIPEQKALQSYNLVEYAQGKFLPQLTFLDHQYSILRDSNQLKWLIDNEANFVSEPFHNILLTNRPN
ncbi:MAG: hypothetical protein AAGD05_17465, partial [Bacteroidota bacterium]